MTRPCKWARGDHTANHGDTAPGERQSQKDTVHCLPCEVQTQREAKHLLRWQHCKEKEGARAHGSQDGGNQGGGQGSRGFCPQGGRLGGCPSLTVETVPYALLVTNTP